MIINAAYEGPPYASAPALGACNSCHRAPQLGNTSPIAGLSYSTVGALVLTTLTIAAIGVTLWSFKPEPKRDPRLRQPSRRGMHGRR